jgi:hypothetical protein
VVAEWRQDLCLPVGHLIGRKVLFSAEASQEINQNNSAVIT